MEAHMETGLSHRKVRVGIVVSNKMDKTVVVKVSRLAEHPPLREAYSEGQEVRGSRRGEHLPHRRPGANPRDASSEQDQEVGAR